MNASPLSPAHPTTNAGFYRKALAFTVGGGLYLLAWAWVIQYPFTWLLAGLMGMATLITYIEERLSKCPAWTTYGEAVRVVWFLMPFALSVVYLYFFFVRPLWH